MKEEKNLNIQSTTIEKGLDLAKDFLGKLISPTIEEIGLLAADQIKYIRFKNQVKILLKARTYVNEKNINIKEVPIKILVPLLEMASLEENEDLQDKYAAMLTNMIDSESNLQNQIFPYILSQISIEEFEALKQLREKEKGHLKERIEYSELRKADQFGMKAETKAAKQKVNDTEQRGFYIGLDGFELENMQRLRLIKQLPPAILIDEFRTGTDSEYSREEWHQLNAEYDSDDYGFRITDLGERFLEICEVKMPAGNS